MTVLRGLLAPLPMLAIAAVLLLAPAGLAAGVWIWPRAWGFLALFGAASMAGQAYLAVAAPASFEVRRQGLVAARDKRQPRIDAVGSIVYALFMAAWFAFIPMDVFRLRLLPAASVAVSVAGAVLTLAGVIIVHAAIAQNRFAAPTIHDQSGEGQRVIDTGLYGLVRHPFYAGMLLVYAGAALWLGSFAALLGASGFLIMTLARIVIEERFLRQNLPAYAEYARRVRGRLIPLIL